MFERLVTFSLNNRGAVILFTVVVAIWGYVSFRDITVEAFPDPTDTQVQIITLFPGQPSEEVERQVGLPLERALNSTPQLSRLRNLSLFGLSFVTLTFRDGVDGLWARQQVLERLREAELPDGITPSLGPYATPIGEVYRYTVEGAGDDPMKLRTLQEWVVRPMLLRVTGVADVVSYGGLVREVQVRPKPEAMASFGLTLSELATALQASSQNASGGVMELGEEQFVIRSEALYKKLDDLRDTGVATRPGGSPVFLREVAEVTEGWAPRQGVVGRGANSDAVQGIVLMRRGENPSVVLAALNQQLTAVNLRLADEGAHINPFYDRTELVDATLKTVGHNLLEGAILVTLVLFIFLLDLRAALIVAAVIPLSLAGAFIFLRQRDLSANLLSMGAVDFGVIVDGGVVIIESILVGLAAHGPSYQGLTVTERIRKGTLEVVRPTVFALLIIIAAYLPIFMLERVEGRIFSPMANTVVAALVGALVFSVTLVPVLASLVYPRGAKHRDSPVLKVAARAYEPTLRFALKYPFVAVGAALLLLVGSGVGLGNLGSEFLPELNEGGIYITFTLPQNVSLTAARKLAPDLRRIIAANPAVEAVMSQLGRPEDGTDAKLSNNLEVFIKLKGTEQWPKEYQSLTDLMVAIEDSLKIVPGLEAGFSQPIRDNVNESISGQQGQIAVKLYGEDLTALQKQAELVKSVVSRVPGVADLAIVKSGEVPQIRVEPDRRSLARHGLTVGQFQDVVETAMNGRTVGSYLDGERRFNVVLRLPQASRDDVEKLKSLRIPIDSGMTVPLQTLATVEPTRGRASINRENGRRSIGIRMNVRGRDMGSFVEEARARVAAEAPLKAGMTLDWGGEFENKERAMKRLMSVVPVALLLTLLLLFKAFDSLGRALVTLANVPFALTGGVLGLWIMDMPLSVSAAVGFIALIGQASLNGVLVTSAIAARREKGESLDEAIVNGARERLRPVMMTALLAALGLVPAVMSRGIGSEVQKPLAVVIVFGTLSAFSLTMVLLPILYRWLEQASAKLSKALPARRTDPAEV